MPVIYKVQGGHQLHGQVDAQGLPGAAMAGIAAALLTQETVTLRHVPHLPALDRLLVELRDIGVAADWTHYHEMTIRAAEVNPFPLLTTTQLLAKLPLLVAAIVLRCGVCRLELTAQDQSNLMELIAVMRQCGALVEVEDGLLRLAFPHCYGIHLSVANVEIQTGLAAMLISVIAEGSSEISGLSHDPQVAAMAGILQSMKANAQLDGAIWRSEGGATLRGANSILPADPMEAGLFGLATLLAGGEVLIRGVDSTQITGFLIKLRQLGAEYRVGPGDQELRFWRENAVKWKPMVIEASQYPGIPASWLPMFLPLLVQANGEAGIMPVDEQVVSAMKVLKGVGAEFFIGGSQARIFGPIKIAAGKMQVHGPADGLAALVAALSAQGVSEISGLEVLEGQFEHLSERFQKLGAKIERREE